MSTILERHRAIHFQAKGRMTIIEEMREADRKLDMDVERIMSSTPRCEIHDCHFVAGCGVAGEPTHVFGPGGGCPQCYWESRKS